jgi:hypothetical protein
VGSDAVTGWKPVLRNSHQLLRFAATLEFAGERVDVGTADCRAV